MKIQNKMENQNNKECFAFFNWYLSSPTFQLWEPHNNLKIELGNNMSPNTNLKQLHCTCFTPNPVKYMTVAVSLKPITFPVARVQPGRQWLTLKA